MILTGETILEKVKKGEIVIRPLDESQIQPASVDLRLSDEFLVVDEHNIMKVDLNSRVKYREVLSREFVVPPKSFVLAKTLEHIEVPLDCTAFVEGRSSIGRLGLFIQNAGWIDPGFKGTITLELFNACNVPIKIEAGRRICQLVFMTLDKRLKKGYSGKYMGQQKVTGSKINEDREALRDLQKKL